MACSGVDVVNMPLRRVFLLCRGMADDIVAGAMTLPLPIADDLEAGGGDNLFRALRLRAVVLGSFFRPLDEVFLLTREATNGRASDDE